MRCRLTAFGGVTWFQPWSPQPPSIARQLAYPQRSGAGGGGEPGGAPGGAGGAPGGEAAAAPEARVVVVDPLPLVQLSLQLAEGAAGGAHESADGLGMLPASSAAGGGEAAPAGGGAGGGAGGAPRALRLLQGQVYVATLAITNTSRAPVGWASVSIR